VYCKTLKELHRAIQKKAWNADIQCSAPQWNACPHTAACTWAPLEHFNWELPDHPPHSPDLALSDSHLFICLKNWSRSQCTNNKVLKCGWAHRQQISLTQAYENLFPNTSASILAVTTIYWEAAWESIFCI
jgi:hypothetical protein